MSSKRNKIPRPQPIETRPLKSSGSDPSESFDSGTESFDVELKLWEAQLKLTGIAHLLMACNVEMLPDKMEFFGLGMALNDYAETLQVIREHIEAKDLRSGSNN